MTRFISILSVALSAASGLTGVLAATKCSGDSTEIQQWLDEHNSLRAQHGAAPLTWNADLAALAKEASQTCTNSVVVDGYGGILNFIQFLHELY